MQMSRSPASSARSASTMPRRSEKVCPNTSRPQPRSRTTSDAMPRSWCSDGSVHERLVSDGGGGTAVRRRWPAIREVTRTPPLDAVRLQPQFEQPQLPELVPLERRELTVGIGDEVAHVLGAEQSALARGLGGQRVAHEVEHLALE